MVFSTFGVINLFFNNGKLLKSKLININVRSYIYTNVLVLVFPSFYFHIKQY